MNKSNDIDLEPDMARLTLSKPSKPDAVDIKNLPISGPDAPSASSKPLKYIKIRAPKDPFMKRKKSTDRRIAEGGARIPASNGKASRDEIDHEVSTFAEPGSQLSFVSLPTVQVEEKRATSSINRFPNLTNPAPYVGPDYGHRDILAANPNPLVHCRSKDPKDKCHVCLLHDFKVTDARLKEIKIRLTDAEIMIKTKASKAQDKLLKNKMEMEGERNAMVQLREEAVKEGIRKARKEWEETYVSKNVYYEMKEGLEDKYKEVEDELNDLQSKIFRL